MSVLPPVTHSSRLSLKARAVDQCKNAYNYAHDASAAQVRTALCWLFWASIVLFPVGPSVREIMPSLCLLVLIRYYYLDWHNSTLRRVPVNFLWGALALGIIVSVVFSQNVWESLLHVARHVNKGYVYPFVAMECVRSTRELQRIIWAFVLVSFWQGLNGVWQAYTGFDFIDNTPIMSGRLTGSMSTYRVGNYIALTLMPALALWTLLRHKYSIVFAACACSVLWLPAAYLLLYSYTRSGYLALLLGICCLMFTYLPAKKRLLALLPLVSFIPMVLLLPKRLGANALAGDGRWDLWRFAWEVFLNKPWFGAGFGEYNAAFRAMGFVPTMDEITISHPHSIYLQLLCESGIVGTTCIMVFLVGFLVWGYSRVHHGLTRASRDNALEHTYYWRLTAFFWAAWCAYMVNGIFGHDFFRLWWFSLAMTLLGVMIGACMNLPAPADTTPKDNAPT